MLLVTMDLLERQSANIVKINGIKPAYGLF